MIYPFSHRICLFSIGLLLTLLVQAQSLSTVGQDFWFGFMNNYNAQPITLEVFISAEDSTSGVLDMPAITSFEPIPFTVVEGITTRIVLPTGTAMSDVLAGIESKGIHITSEGPISVFAMNKRETSADAAVIFPTFSLSSEYLIMSHWEDGNRNGNANSNSEFLVVAVVDNTEIEIVPSVMTLDGLPAGEPINITLDAGETFQVMAPADLTGSSIRGLNNESGECFNFAVFAGNQYTQVGSCGVFNGHDHLFAQQYPLKTWGRNFITVNYEPREVGDVVKILAQFDETQVNVAGSVYNLNAGEFVQLLLDGVNNISSDKPIAVGQFSRTQGCDGEDIVGDPFYVLLSPNEQLLSEITFFSPGVVTTSEFSLNVISPRSGVNTITLDGNLVGNQFTPVPGNGAFSYARFALQGGNHTITSEDGFIAYVYAYGYTESYGYSAGVGLSNLNLDVEIRDLDGNRVPFDEVCKGELLEYVPITEIDFDSYEWVFGDGARVFSDSLSVFHRYDTSGTFLFELTGIQAESQCTGGSEASEVRILQVQNPQLDIFGPRSVCPFTEDVLYVTNFGTGLQTSWGVTGGKIVADFGDSIRIDWGETNDSAAVKLVAINAQGCAGDTVFLPVKINLRLEPDPPRGIDTLCSNELQGHQYEAYYFNGSVYDWEIEGGTIVSGNGSREVTVDWAGHGVGKLWYLQSVPGADICEGVSDTLFVLIQRFPDPNVNILVPKEIFQLNEEVVVGLEVDSLYDLASWWLNDELIADSVDLDFEPHYLFDCPGNYEFKVEVYDTSSVCSGSSSGSKVVIASPPIPHIISVSADTSVEDRLVINYAIEGADFGEYTFAFRSLNQGHLFAQEVAETAGTTHRDRISTAVKYWIRLYAKNETCTTEFVSEGHNNIVLTGENQESDKTGIIEWSEYVGWQNGVDIYNIYQSIDGSAWREVAQTTDLTYQFESDDSGFDYCFRILADERGGAGSFSWSNEACLFFAPDLHAYNVFTPNGDALNQNFQVDNIEAYRNCELTIYNRYGKIVYQAKGYRNDWNGDDLPAGVYYFVIYLNEPRVEMKSINGHVTILR